MKYTPKKVFILEDGKYIEMPYEEFNRRSQTDRARGKPCRKNPCDTAQSVSQAKTGRSIKDTCVRSIGRALKRGSTP